MSQGDSQHTADIDGSWRPVPRRTAHEIVEQLHRRVLACFDSLLGCFDTLLPDLHGRATGAGPQQESAQDPLKAYSPFARLSVDRLLACSPAHLDTISTTLAPPSWVAGETLRDPRQMQLRQGLDE